MEKDSLHLTNNVEPTKCRSIESMMQCMSVALPYSEKTWHQKNECVLSPESMKMQKRNEPINVAAMMRGDQRYL